MFTNSYGESRLSEHQFESDGHSEVGHGEQCVLRHVEEDADAVRDPDPPSV